MALKEVSGSVAITVAQEICQHYYLQMVSENNESEVKFLANAPFTPRYRVS